MGLFVFVWIYKEKNFKVIKFKDFNNRSLTETVNLWSMLFGGGSGNEISIGGSPVYTPVQTDNLASFYRLLEKKAKDGDFPFLGQFPAGDIQFDPFVQNLQIALNFLGYGLDEFGIDGKFGEETARAIIQFKDDNDLDIEGRTTEEKSKITADDILMLVKLLKDKGFSASELQKYTLQSSYDIEPSKISGDVLSNSYTGNEAKNIDILKASLIKNGITNPYTISAILSTCAKESGFKPSRPEISYRNTSNRRIRNIFGRRVSGLSDEELDALKSNDSLFWDRVYGPDDPTGNSQKYGNTQRGDGEKYRGRGYNGITFKNNYKKYTDLLKKNGIDADLVANPDKLFDPIIAAEVASLYFINAFTSKKAKDLYGIKGPNDFKDLRTAVTAAVHSNAGFGKSKASIESGENLKKAMAASSRFPVSSVSTLA